MADQAVISATHFVLGVTLARLTPAANYGAWALAVGVLLILASVQSAVVTTPLTILGAAREEAALRRWVSALLAGQAVLAAALAALLAAGALAFGLASGDRALAGALAALAGALVFVQAQEFCRRVLFLRLAVARVLANDAVFCGLQAAGVAALWWLDRRAGGAGAWLSAANVLHVTAGAALAASALGLYQVRKLLSMRGLSGAGALLREAWEMGRYNLGAHAGSVVLLYGNRFVAAALGGTVSVAMLEAPRLLVAPLHVASISAAGVTVPRAAQAYAGGGRKGLLAFLTPVAAVWAGGFLAYALVLAVAPGFWLRLLYGGAFAGAEPVLVLWCVCYAVAGLRVLPATALRVTRRWAAVMWTSLAAGGAMLATALPLGALLGVKGVVLGRLVGDVTALAGLTAAFARASGPAAAAPRDDRGADAPGPRAGQ